MIFEPIELGSDQEEFNEEEVGKSKEADTFQKWPSLSLFSPWRVFLVKYVQFSKNVTSTVAKKFSKIGLEH